jgi:uncharacterized protein (DUF2267 family)
MTHPVIETLSAVAVVAAIAVVAVIIPTPRHKPEELKQEATQSVQKDSGDKPSVDKPDSNDARVHALEEKVSEARADLQEIKAALKEKVRKDGERR